MTEVTLGNALLADGRHVDLNIENGRITEVAGPRAERLAEVAAALFAGRGDAVEVREIRGGLLAQPGDPDAEAYAAGAALPNPGAKLAGPTFAEWLKATSEVVEPRVA